MSPSGSSVPPSFEAPSSSSKSRTQAPQQQQQQQQHQEQYKHRYYTHEERLSKDWRKLASGIVDIFQRAEAAATAAQSSNADPQQVKKLQTELDRSVINNFLKTRMEFHRLISHVEARLQGKAQEREALETFVRTQPSLGKRKREEDLSAPADDVGAVTGTANAPAAAQSPSA